MPADLTFQGINDKTKLWRYPSPSPTPKEAWIWYLFISSIHTMSTYSGPATRKQTERVSAPWADSVVRCLMTQDGKDRISQCHTFTLAYFITHWEWRVTSSACLTWPCFSLYLLPWPSVTDPTGKGIPWLLFSYFTQSTNANYNTAQSAFYYSDASFF